MASNIRAWQEAPLLHFPVLDSTNNYAMQLAGADMPPHGLTIVADRQTAGKGQRGAAWVDEPGESVLMSVIIRPNLLLEQQFIFSAAVAISVANVIQHFLQQAKVAVKWPNDIIINDRKAGGILIENIIRGHQWLYAVTGIGINILQESFPESLPFATSLRLEGGENLEVFRMVEEIREALLDKLSMQIDPDTLIQEYNGLLYRKNEVQYFRSESDAWDAHILRVDSDGRLITKPLTAKRRHTFTGHCNGFGDELGLI